MKKYFAITSIVLGIKLSKIGTFFSLEHKKLWIGSNLLKKPLTLTSIFCALHYPHKKYIHVLIILTFLLVHNAVKLGNLLNKLNFQF